MNKFHLLSLEEEAEAMPTDSISASKNANKHSSKDFSAKSNTHLKEKPKKVTKFDRHSRSLRKGEGEKHQTNGKGSWGRAIDAEERAAEGASAEAKERGDDSVEPVEISKPIAMKTVKEYLAEQEEKQRRLQSRPSAPLRKANEGTEIEPMEVIKKSNDTFIVGKNSTPSSSSSATANKTSVPKDNGLGRMSLQDLNKLIPLPVRRDDQTPRRDSSFTKDSSTRRNFENRNRDGAGNNEKGKSNNNNRGNSERRSHNNNKTGTDRRFGSKNDTRSTVKIDLTDKNAFPSLA